MRIRNFAPVLLLGVLCLAQESWETAPEYPGVDWHGISGARKDAAFKFIREEKCSCGCTMKIAECRMKDPTCSYSRKLASVAMKGFAAGENAAAVREDVKKAALEPPPVLEPPVKISLAGDPAKGPDNARVTIVEFSDFQCPYCAKAAGEAAQLVQKFPKEVKLVFKQFPLDDHSQAELAAEASLAAQAQGKFWPMHDKMYANFRQINRDHILVWATEIGLDMNRFRTELDGHKYTMRVRAEEQEGETAGVEGTPTFYINGQKFNGVFEVKAIAPIVADELKK